MTAGPTSRPTNNALDQAFRFSVLAAFVVVGILLYYADFAQPVQIAQALPQSQSSIYINMLTVAVTGHVNSTGIPLQINGQLSQLAASATGVELDIKPSGGSQWQEQGCDPITGSQFSCSASLSPAAQQSFDYQIRTIGDRSTLAAGDLVIHVESFPGGSQLAIVIINGLGTLTALLEILNLMAERRTAPESA